MHAISFYVHGCLFSHGCTPMHAQQVDVPRTAAQGIAAGGEEDAALEQDLPDQQAETQAGAAPLSPSETLQGGTQAAGATELQGELQGEPLLSFVRFVLEETLDCALVRHKGHTLTVYR